MIVNNSINIKKTYKPLSSQIINIIKSVTFAYGYPGPGLGHRYKNMSGLNQLIGCVRCLY